MEAALLHSSVDHQESMSPCKRVRNPKRNNQARSFIPSRTNSSGNLYYSESLPKKMEMMVNGGVFLSPPFPLSSSLPRLNSSPYPLQFHQPPLLPLPMSTQFRSLPTSGGANRGNPDHSPSHKKQNKGNKYQTNAKASKQGTTSPQKATYATNTKQYPAAKSDASRLGPDPGSLPKFNPKEVVMFPQAPPPSSLPMPKFSLKPKLSCKVEAASVGVGGRVDAAGATNGLYRLLNLR